MLGSNWERVVENVRTFIQVRDEHARTGGNRCRVTFQLTFMEINHVQIPAVVELAAQLGVDRVKGHHLWVHTPKMKGQSHAGEALTPSPGGTQRCRPRTGRRSAAGCPTAAGSCWRTSSR